VNELYGKEVKDVVLSFPAKIVDAYEVNGQEKRIGNADLKNGVLNFDMTRFLIRSFAVKFENPASPLSKPSQATVELPYNQDGISFDTKRNDGNFVDRLTIPAEMLPAEVVSEDIVFRMGSTAEGQKNVLSAAGQKINLPAGKYNKFYILAAATEDSQGEIKAGNKITKLSFQNWTGYVGQHYNRELTPDNLKVVSIAKAYTKRDNIAWFASHRHTPDTNDTYKYSYLYKYEISLPEGTKSVTLPENEKIKIFAITVADNKNDYVVPLQLLYDDFKNDKPLVLRIEASGN
jgi:alpha-mannosidase